MINFKSIIDNIFNINMLKKNIEELYNINIFSIKKENNEYIIKFKKKINSERVNQEIIDIFK